MSDRRARLYLHDILDSGKAIEEYTKDFSYEQFVKDRKTVSATLREFEIIGEELGSFQILSKNNIQKFIGKT